MGSAPCYGLPTGFQVRRVYQFRHMREGPQATTANEKGPERAQHPSMRLLPSGLFR